MPTYHISKAKTVAILGYGSTGASPRTFETVDEVVIGQSICSANYDLAVSHGFAADVVNILLPDEVQADIFRNEILGNLSPGNVLMCSHGFNIHFEQIVPPAGIDTLLVAPKGPGHLVRSEYEKGGGVPCLIALGDGAAESTKQIDLRTLKVSEEREVGLKPPSLRRPRQICSANKLCYAVGLVSW